MLSFWERESFIDYDVIIVGAGITGLSSAISLLEKEPALNILVLEKSIFPSGASTKNAGFACFGSLSELLSDIETMGQEECLELVKNRWAGLQKLRNRFTDEELGFEPLGGYELFRESQGHYLKSISEINDFLSPVFKTEVFTDLSNRIEDFGFNSSSFSSMTFNKFEGQINTGKTLSALWKKATHLGAKVLTGCEVVSVSESGVQVVSSDGELTFTSKKTVICINGFTQTIFPDLDLAPGRGQVLITYPIKDLKFQGTFHMEEGYFYFRNVGNRILFGGGRNLDMKVEETTEHGINSKIEKELLSILKNDLIPNQDFQIDRQWSGIMAFGDVKKPLIQWVDTNTFIGVRLGGMGMALGSHLGEIISEEILSSLAINSPNS